MEYQFITKINKRLTYNIEQQNRHTYIRYKIISVLFTALTLDRGNLGTQQKLDNVDAIGKTDLNPDINKKKIEPPNT